LLFTLDLTLPILARIAIRHPGSMLRARSLTG
jgi:hypothetical protein